MKRYKKNIIVYLLILFISIIFIFYLTQEKILLKDSNHDKEIIVEVNNTKTEELKLEQKLKEKEEKEEEAVVLRIENKDYDVLLNSGDTVYDVMNNLKNDKEKNFSFKYKEYTSLGIFIDEIGELKNGNGKYLIYSINGKEAQVGVSKYKLQAGDIISWELK